MKPRHFRKPLEELDIYLYFSRSACGTFENASASAVLEGSHALSLHCPSILHFNPNFRRIYSARHFFSSIVASGSVRILRCGAGVCSRWRLVKNFPFRVRSPRGRISARLFKVRPVFFTNMIAIFESTIFGKSGNTFFAGLRMFLRAPLRREGTRRDAGSAAPPKGGFDSSAYPSGQKASGKSEPRDNRSKGPPTQESRALGSRIGKNRLTVGAIHEVSCGQRSSKSPTASNRFQLHG